jgi:hypothetical protein
VVIAASPQAQGSRQKVKGLKEERFGRKNRSIKKFSPNAVKAGTAQGEEEGEGTCMSISSQKSVRIRAFRPHTRRIFGLEPLVSHFEGFRVMRVLVLADPLEIQRFGR